MNLPIIKPTDDLHTSEMTDACPRKAALRMLGHTDGKAPTALVRGLIAGKAIELHEMDGDTLDGVADRAATLVVADLRREGRVMTEAAERDLADIVTEIQEAIVRWPEAKLHLGDISIIGCELPVRATIDCPELFGVAGPQKFASHLDILARDKHGRLVVIDLKWRDESPSWAYLNRNLQIAAYALAANDGHVLLPSGTWHPMKEQRPRLVWLHLPHLKPVKRKTTLVDPDTAETIELAKGDPRPIRWACRELEFDSAFLKRARYALAERVRMYRMGFWPMIPEPVKCHLCEAEAWCPRFDKAN